MKTFWQRLFKTPLHFGLFLIIAWSVPRFWLVLEANRSGNYQWVSLIFITMILAPFIFLNKKGRRKMGLRRPHRWGWLLGALFLGIACATLTFAVGVVLFGYAQNNWFIYIAQSYTAVPEHLTMDMRWLYFGIYTAISITFSPIGEEFFYRGMVHEAFAERLGDERASFVDSLAFSVVHLAHFGLVFIDGNLRFLPIPAIFWMSLLFGACLVFFFCRQRADSIWGAVVAHAGFNLGMNYFIFFQLMS